MGRSGDGPASRTGVAWGGGEARADTCCRYQQLMTRASIASDFTMRALRAFCRAVGLTVGAGYARMLAGDRNRPGFQAEDMEARGAGRERAVQHVEHVQDSVLAVDVASAHAADADQRIVEHPWHPLGAAEVVIRVPALDDWHETIGDSPSLAAPPAEHVEPHRSGNPVEHRVLVPGHLRLCTPVLQGPPDPRCRSGEIKIIGCGPGKAAIKAGCNEACGATGLVAIRFR